METNEIIALALGLGIIVLVAIYESIMHKLMKDRLREARDRAASWKELYRSVSEERDLLHRRLVSRDCQKVLAIQSRLDDAVEEIQQLRTLNENYKRQIEETARKKRTTASK